MSLGVPSQFAKFEPVINPVISLATSPIFPGIAAAPVKMLLKMPLFLSSVSVPFVASFKRSPIQSFPAPSSNEPILNGSPH